MKKNYFKALLFLFLGFQLQAQEIELVTNDFNSNCNETSQYLYWTGEENSDFFNENNWRLSIQVPSQNLESGLPFCLPGANKQDYQICLGQEDLVNDQHPRQGSVDPGISIKYNLYASQGILEANGKISFNCDTKGLTLSGSKIRLKQTLVNGVLSLNNNSTVYLEQNLNNASSTFNLLDVESWIYFYKNNPIELEQQNISQFYVNDLPATLDFDLKFDQYYQEGTIVRQKNNYFAPLLIFNDRNLSGTPGLVKAHEIYKGGEIPEGLDNAISSFKLKRGYQATFAIQKNGTSMSKVYIASEEDLEITDLPAALENNISFIRVVRWEWIVKKGTGGYYNDLNAGWYYNWGNGTETEANYQYVPMAWGAGGASSSSLQKVIAKEDVSQLLGFNESDNCNDQSGQYNNLCDPAVAVAYYENLMGSGMRLGTPAPRENGPFGWLADFSRIAKERNVRFDFVAVHWYDWGSNPANTPNASASEIFNRFKNYLKNVHEKYNLPIWITEFNANPNRGTATQEAFLKLALPYLESLDYIERYAFFQPDPRFAQNAGEMSNYRDEAGNLTNIGNLYLNHPSTPSIPELVYPAPNNLEGLDVPFEEKEPLVLSFEAECSNLLGNQLSLIQAEDASNNYYLQLDASKEGASSLAKQVHFDIDVEITSSYRIWLRYKSLNGTNTSVKVDVDESNNFQNIAAIGNVEFNWEQLPRFYDLLEGKHRITIEIPNNRFLLDAIALINDSGSVDLIPQDAETCTPPENRWGVTQTNTTYFLEAEEASILGSDWKTGSSATAINETYIQSSLTATEIPPGTSGQAVFELEVAESDRYEIWGKIQALTTDSDAFWIKVDDGNFEKWENLQSELFLWYWKKFHASVNDKNTSLGYFLEAGKHRVTIAYNNAKTKIDRLAVSSFGKSPADEDPNILFPQGKLEFEAELAILTGNSGVLTCLQSSNGQQVTIGKNPANKIRFEGIGIAQAGNYNLKVSYMSAVSRRFGLVVNGEQLPNQVVPSSGDWCYNNGVPGIYEVDVALKAGENIIEITGLFVETPFIDKIAIGKRNVYEMEAEDAELIGNSTIQDCDAASKGLYVNTLSYGENAISFNDININEEGNYTLNIGYLRPDIRMMLLKVNDGEFQIVQFKPSGKFCFEGGAPAIHQINIDLQAGINTIVLKNSGSPAPLIDRISLRENDTEEKSQLELTTKAQPTVEILSEETDEGTDMVIFPNPIESGTEFTVALPSSMSKNGLIQIFDLLGKLHFSKEYINPENGRVSLQPSLNSGTYAVTISDEIKKYSKLLFVK